jgi:glycosyltransferase involved in cell wall biosynthesis
MRVLVLTAIYPKPDKPAFGSFVRTQVLGLRAAGVDVDVLVLDGQNRKLIYPQGVFGLRRRIADNPPELVHAHYSYVGAVARTQWSVPIVLTYHGDDLLGTAGFDGRVKPLSRVIAAGGRALGSLVDAVIVQNQQMAARFRHREVHVIPHEVDLGVFSASDRCRARAQLGLDPDRRYVLFAADPQIPVKNFPLAQRAVEAAQRSLPDLELELLVVHREPQPRLALYMSACDVLAFPSWQEGSPNIIKQAMACNLPIVSTDVGDVRTLISATDGCHVTEPAVDPFARALAAESQLQRRTDGRDAVAHLTPDLVSRRLISVYDSVLSAQAARGRSRLAGRRDKDAD